MASVRTTMLAIMLVACLVPSAMAKTYIVGDDAGWTIPPGGSLTFYDDWAAKITFLVGDKLTFTYKTGHNVYQVSASDAKKCDGTNPIAKFDGANPTIVLTDAGEIYYICQIPTHCDLGMSMTLTVFANSTEASKNTPPAETPSLNPMASPPAPPATPSAAAGVRSTGAVILGSLLALAAALLL